MKIRFNEVANLPENDLKVLEFQRQIEEEEKMWDSVQAGDELKDEQSKAYFERYIADRR